MREQRLSKIHFFILLSLFGFVFPLRSQEYKFRTLGVEDGLSQITVSDICQDEKSRIWIATLDGLNCFDGNHIKVFNHFHNDSISYGNLYVTQMVEDGQGSLFLLASTGLFQFDLETEKYYILPVTSPSTLAKGKTGVWIAEGGNCSYTIRIPASWNRCMPICSCRIVARRWWKVPKEVSGLL